MPGRTKTVLVAGAPAVGKGTQCEKIIEAFGLVHISPGEILRDHVRRDTEVGRQAAKAMNAGHLVPSDLVIQVVKERMSQADVANRGCLLDNFPLTAEQAEAMQGHIQPDVLLYMEASEEVLQKRAQGRLLDPRTGAIYHEDFKKPPKNVEARLERREDDSEALVIARLKTYKKHIAAILPYFKVCMQRIDADRPPHEVFADIKSVLASKGWGPTEDEPYVGSKAFGGPFSAEDAQRAGFYSPDSPPEVGDRVVCFQRGSKWQREGIVVSMEEKESDGSDGLKEGVTGLWVEVDRDGEIGSPMSASSVPRNAKNRAFQAWSVFLAPCNDMEYSSLCTTAKFQASNFCRLWRDVGDVPYVTFGEARASLQEWLRELEDSDGEPIEVSETAMERILAAFDTKERPSLYVYSTNMKLTSRTQAVMGRDFSIYYRALNNTLNNDNEAGLQRALPLMQHMVRDILYDENGEKRRHKGGKLWKGDAQRPVPLNMQKLREACAMGTAVRFRQFQSTTSDRNMAVKYQRREDGRGFLWSMDVPEDFWGASEIADVAWRTGESETLFPPYAAFLVQAVSEGTCHLVATDFTRELEERALRHGLRGSAVELLEY
eukprot:CAMPEP_0178442286 /NCGR_PEP_ID=MMETSP0689_2-20121128/38060_1 /TAXON_ID=160604 /ORGANISM="Amphidinium massartii, Strain CS-259" /LENGTH=603 /DNA_ID=CAMNT_0020065775 /DNA_START=223 /DNA_END=2034 /DNA_ORIENTATION=-